MKIDGKTMAQNVLSRIKNDAEKLRGKGIVPRLAIILVGNDSSSDVYVRQKEIKAKVAGIETISLRFPASVSQEELSQNIRSLNTNPEVSAIIVQRPLPKQIDDRVIDELISPQKDVDGFQKSTFIPPIVRAVVRILEDTLLSFGASLDSYFSSHSLVIIGKGKTAGEPLINYFKSHGIEPVIVDSKTKNADKTTRKADVIISAVGQPEIIKSENIKKGCILISVGMYRNRDGKLAGDFDEEKIKDKAFAYTPTPGGVGPMNVAMLLENVIEVAKSTQ